MARPTPQKAPAAFCPARGTDRRRESPTSRFAQPPAGARDLSTPEKAIAALLAAFSAQDPAGLAACLVESAPTDRLSTLFFFFSGPAGPRRTVAVGSATVLRQTETDALVRVQLESSVRTAPPQPLPPGQPEAVTLRRVGAAWKIVAPKNHASSRGFVDTLARFAADPNDAPPERLFPSSTTWLAWGNVSRLAMACLSLARDNAGVFRLAAANLKPALLPYVGEAGLFHSPLDKPGVVALRLNPALANVALSRVDLPARTVLLFEGAPGRPRFRYEGKAVVGFVDGHVEMVTPAEAKRMKWKP